MTSAKTVFELGAMIGTYMHDHDSSDVDGFVDFVVGLLVVAPDDEQRAGVIGWYQARAAYLTNKWAIELGERQTPSDELELAGFVPGRLTSVELEAGQLEAALSGATTMLVAAARKTDALARELAEQRARGDASMWLDEHTVGQAAMLAGIVRVGLEELEAMLALVRSTKKES